MNNKEEKRSNITTYDDGIFVCVIGLGHVERGCICCCCTSLSRKRGNTLAEPSQNKTRAGRSRTWHATHLTARLSRIASHRGGRRVCCGYNKKKRSLFTHTHLCISLYLHMRTKRVVLYLLSSHTGLFWLMWMMRFIESLCRCASSGSLMCTPAFESIRHEANAQSLYIAR